jgi:hypothetical protein
MRGITLTLASLMIGAFAFAVDAPRIDLDRPGALDQLKLEHPKRFQAVNAVLLASKRAPCQADAIKLLEARLDVRDLECGMMVFTSYPALRHVSFELEGTHYTATVALEEAEVLQPVATGAELPSTR